MRQRCHQFAYGDCSTTFEDCSIAGFVAKTICKQIQQSVSGMLTRVSYCFSFAKGSCFRVIESEQSNAVSPTTRYNGINKMSYLVKSWLFDGETKVPKPCALNKEKVSPDYKDVKDATFSTAVPLRVHYESTEASVRNNNEGGRSYIRCYYL